MTALSIAGGGVQGGAPGARTAGAGRGQAAQQAAACHRAGAQPLACSGTGVRRQLRHLVKQPAGGGDLSGGAASGRHWLSENDRGMGNGWGGSCQGTSGLVQGKVGAWVVTLTRLCVIYKSQLLDFQWDSLTMVCGPF